MKNIIACLFRKKIYLFVILSLCISQLSQARSNHKSDTLEEIQKQYEHLIKKFSTAKIDKFENALRVVVDADQVFEPNSKTFKQIEDNLLPSLFEHLKKFSNSEFIVTIHSDTDGDDAMNLEISKRRATELKNYFQKNGIKSNRFKCIGLGESQALNFKKGDIIKTNNRIEILILADH